MDVNYPASWLLVTGRAKASVLHFVGTGVGQTGSGD